MVRMAVIVLIFWMCLPEVLLAGVVLEAGEIDSGKVRVGVFAEVVYGKGERDPVSGEWEKLVTASGYIKAVDAEGLTLALGRSFRKHRKKRIAFARIQKLLLAESRREMARLKDTLRRWKQPVSVLQPSEGRRNGIAEVVLKAGEIDSGKVRVGIFAELVYGKGKRDPVSGDWKKLVTARGYIKAVDAEGLTLGGIFRKKRIAFARIQRLLLTKSSREMARLRKTIDKELPFARTDAGSWRSEGQFIRIHTRGTEEGIVARVHRATRDTLFYKKRMSILRREKGPASIAITDISRLEVYKYRESYAKEGAIVGAAAGIAGVLVDLQEAAGVPHPILLLMPPILGLMGGALAGSMLGHDVWQTVDHLSPSIVEGRRRLSYRLSFRF